MTAPMPLRSMLFIPGDSEKKMAKAATCGADAVILDLEDSVAPQNKAQARALVAVFLGATARADRPCQYWVRINPFDTGLSLDDLAAVVPGVPDGIMQPKTDSPDDVRRLSYYLDALEVAHGIDPGTIRIVPIATETARAPFALGDFAGAGLDRLLGLTWGAEDLATAIGASTNRDGDGEWAYTFRTVRALTLLAARAAGVQPIDTLHADFGNEAALCESCLASRADGFTGRLAIHPAQVATINACFTPSAQEVAHAERILAAFAANPGAGTVGLDGKMIDIPHRKQAEAILAQARAFALPG